MAIIKLLFPYLLELYRLERWKLIFDLVLAVFLGLLEGAGIIMLLPLLTLAGITGGQLTGVGAMAEKYIHLPENALPVVLIIYIGINIAQALLQRYESILSMSIRQSFVTDQYTELYRIVTNASWSFFLKVKRAEVFHYISTEMTKIFGGVYQLLQMCTAGIISLVQLAVAFLLAPYLTLLILCCGVLFSACMQFSVRESRELGERMSKKATEVFVGISEHFNGIKEIKSYGVELTQTKNFEQQMLDTGKMVVDLIRVQSKTSMLYKVGLAVFISAFYYSAISFFSMDPRELIIIYVIFSRLWPRFTVFQSGLQSLANLLPAVQAVTDLKNRCLAEAETTVEPRAAERLELRRGIELRDVSFRYNIETENITVDNINLTMPAGTTTAIVGSSGAGKSTLADLVLGLIVPESGSIRVDDIRLTGETRHAWRRSIGYVPQETFLFNASIRKNLLWACPEAADEEIWEALRLAAIDKFVESLPDKLDTVVGDRGIRLSGGERQRVVLARALLRRPALLILDEATSALDTENEKRIQDAVESLRGKLTIMVIAHRISTNQNADQIMVMDKGRIVERGTYQALLADKDSRFSRLAQL